MDKLVLGVLGRWRAGIWDRHSEGVFEHRPVPSVRERLVVLPSPDDPSGNGEIFGNVRLSESPPPANGGKGRTPIPTRPAFFRGPWADPAWCHVALPDVVEHLRRAPTIQAC